MFWTASHMSLYILGSPLALVAPMSGGFKYLSLFIQFGLHWNVIFNRVIHWDYCKCFGHHLTCRQASCGRLGPPRAYIGQIGIFCDIYSIRVTLQCNIQSNALFRLSQMFLTASDMSSDILQSASGLLGPISGVFQYFMVSIQLGLHCNVIIHNIHCSDSNKCFGQHLTCFRASCGPHRVDSVRNIMQRLAQW